MLSAGRPKSGAPANFRYLVTLLLFLLWFVLWKTTLGLGLVDDGYIFLRYARNWANGLGPVFNPGERVEGFSSPLWTALLTPGELLFQGSGGFGIALGVVSASLMLTLFVREISLETRSSMAGLVFGLVLACSPGIAFWACSGMDMSLFSAWVFAVLLGTCRDQQRARASKLTSVLLALLCLTRMEGLLLFGLVAFVHLLRRHAVGWLALPLATTLAGLAARRAYFGDWLPNTFYAKAAGNTWLNLSNGLAYTARAALVHSPVLVLVLILSWLHLRSRTEKQQTSLLPFFLFVPGWIIYVAGVGGDHFRLHRFWLPIIPCLAYLAVVLAARWCRSRQLPLRLMVVTAVALLASFAVATVREGPAGLSEVRGAQRWYELGVWLRTHLPPKTVVGSIPIGGIGYGSGLPILDLVGLTNREIGVDGNVAPEAAAGHRRYNSDHVLRQKPGCIFINFGGPRLDECPMYKSYNAALEDLLARDATHDVYRVDVYECGPGRYAHFLMRRDLRPLPGLRESSR